MPSIRATAACSARPDSHGGSGRPATVTTPTGRGSGDPAPRRQSGSASLPVCISVDGAGACLLLEAHTPSPVRLSRGAVRPPPPGLLGVVRNRWGSLSTALRRCLGSVSPGRDFTPLSAFVPTGHRDVRLRAAFHSQRTRPLRSFVTTVPPSPAAISWPPSPPGASDGRAAVALPPEP